MFKLYTDVGTSELRVDAVVVVYATEHTPSSKNYSNYFLAQTAGP